jgi:CTP synthase
MAIDIARHMLGKKDANSVEFNPDTSNPVIDLMPDQKDVVDMGGTMRLGIYPCQLVPDSMAERAYGQTLIYERHRHRFEFNNKYREEFESVGLWPTGLSPDGRLVEIMEKVDQRFMVGVQFHPEFLSRPNRPHPLFREFVGAAKMTLREGGQHTLPLDSAESSAIAQKV